MTEYVDSIWEDIKWLTGEEPSGGVFYGSDYFETCFECAVQLIKDGKAYVDDLTQEEMREYRGSLTEPGKPSPYRDRSVEENLAAVSAICATASSPTAPRPCAPRSTWPART